ncbi:MAG: hypothetical protein S4CHLAM7_02590 [Chlamydiae bacterium]|nr:hypothetical protein [Chlamydiota bacterium]
MARILFYLLLILLILFVIFFGKDTYYAVRKSANYKKAKKTTCQIKNHIHQIKKKS